MTSQEIFEPDVGPRDRAMPGATGSPPASSARATDPSVRAADLLLLAVTLGMLVGLVYAGSLSLRHRLVGGFTFTGKDVVWMSPIANVTLFVLVAAPLAALPAMVRRRWASLFALTALTFVGTLSMALLLPRVHPAAAAILALGAAWSFARPYASDPARWRARVWRTGGVLALVSLVLGVWSERSSALVERRAMAALPAAAAGTPNVLLIILDTVRAASLSLYGSARATSPVLDRLASEGTTFDMAIAPSSWTLPSHASVFTGRHAEGLSARWRTPLDSEARTLAEVLQARGYATGGFVANLYYTIQQTGLDRGFIRWRDFPRTLRQVMWRAPLMQVPLVRDVIQNRQSPAAMASAIRTFDWRLGPEPTQERKRADVVSAEFLDWQRSLAGRPFFAFLNYFDAHDPYDIPPPYRTRFASDPSGRDRYEGAIAYTDERLGRMLAELRRRGVLDNTIVVITADHGEQFGEHGLNHHGNSLYLPLLHVPLVVRWPGAIRAGARVAAPVSLTDVSATVLELLDSRAAARGGERLPGRSLVPFLVGDGGAPSWPVISHVERGGNAAKHEPSSRGDMRSILVDRYHYIRNGDGVEELYDIVADPGETTDRARDAAAGEHLRTLRRLVADPTSR